MVPGSCGVWNIPARKHLPINIYEYTGCTKIQASEKYSLKIHFQSIHFKQNLYTAF